MAAHKMLQFVMPTREQMTSALDIIIGKVPSLAGEAMKAKGRRDEILMAKALNRLAAAALGTSVLTPADRKRLIAVCGEVEDDSYSFMLRVRLSRLQERILNEKASEKGMDLSKYVRTTLFGEDA